jgi:hypothetical protein
MVQEFGAKIVDARDQAGAGRDVIAKLRGNLGIDRQGRYAGPFTLPTSFARPALKQTDRTGVMGEQAVQKPQD